MKAIFRKPKNGAGYTRILSSKCSQSIKAVKSESTNSFYKARPTALTAVRRGIENEPRDVAIYLIRSMRSDSLMKIGGRFGLNRYSSVSSVVMRVKTKLKKDRQFKQGLAHIERIVLKGQT
jgi:chromosomal replication initiation ATPase DnaA